MNAQVEQIYELIMMYAPMVLTLAGVLVNFFMILKKLKDINIKEDMNDALKDTDDQIKELVAHTKIIQQENQLLRQKTDRLLEALTKVEQKDDDSYKEI